MAHDYSQHLTITRLHAYQPGSLNTCLSHTHIYSSAVAATSWPLSAQKTQELECLFGPNPASSGEPMMRRKNLARGCQLGLVRQRLKLARWGPTAGIFHDNDCPKHLGTGLTATHLESTPTYTEAELHMPRCTHKCPPGQHTCAHL